MQLHRLRLSGFKSFSDPAELAIEPGLTGVVGPNGCGKSNIVEALRWAMGESSARGLRGEEMEDVIFNGAAGRPAFDVAEVRLRLSGPVAGVAELQNAAEVEVSRRLVRGQGSLYRLNGREVRARDVQLLFADAGAGRHSASFIGQGQVGFIVESRPQERRRLLEEAAGIGGLHARRRDAEQRLAATEANLQRAHDLMREQEARLAELERQDRQAERYRKLAAELRTAEAVYLLARFKEAEAALGIVREAEAAARRQCGEAQAVAGEARRTRDGLATALPGQRRQVAERTARLAALRERQAQLAAAVARLRTHREALERQAAELAADRTVALAQVRALGEELAASQRQEAELTAEASRVAALLPEVAAAEAEAAARLEAAERTQRAALAELARIEAALAHVSGEVKRARGRLATLDAALAGFGAVGDPGGSEADGAAAVLLGARQDLEAAEGTLAVAEGEALAARQEAAKLAAEAALRRERLAAAEVAAREAAGTLASLRERHAAVERAGLRLAERERALAARLAASRAALPAVDAARLEGAAASAAAALKAADGRLDATRERAALAEVAKGEAGQAARVAQRALDALDAELRVLASLAAEVAAGALLPRLSIPESHTRALAAALADDLLAGDDPESPLHWRDLGLGLETLPPLPEGATPLSECASGPGLLARRLSQVGVVEAERGAGLQARLRPGQRLVSPEGHLWRWDGLVRAATAEETGSARVRHRLRLEAAGRERVEAAAALAQALAEEGERVEALVALRRELATVEAVWRQADGAQSGAAQRLAVAAERSRELEGEIARLAAEELALGRERDELEQERQGFAGTGPTELALEATKAGLERCRGTLETAERAWTAAADRLVAADRAVAAARERVTGRRVALEAAREAVERERNEREVRTRAAAERRAHGEALAAERQELVGSLGQLAHDELQAVEAAERARAEAARAEAVLHAARDDSQAATGEAARLRERARELRATLTQLGAAHLTAKGRLAEAEARAEATQARQDRLAGEVAALGRGPQADESGLALEIAGLDAEQAEAGAALAEAEAGLAQFEAELTAAEALLGAGRERLALAQAERARAEAGLEAAAALVLERLQRPARALLQDGATALLAAKADTAEIEVQLGRLRAARERIGPVNLRAGVEAEEVRAALERTRAEAEELRAAVGRLKQATARLSREGRERLQEVFAAVDSQFRQLFVRLFGGGRAQLRLIETDDPLQAGLELEASPPGKKLTSINLLSGGEKTLTALALVFAFFLARPSPLCVLDEADAPLDDANVDRFVTLMREIAAETGTRFLVVTHHPLTMTRMDRLYGVTMSERGVSRLVSVALEEAAALQASA